MFTIKINFMVMFTLIHQLPYLDLKELDNKVVLIPSAQKLLGQPGIEPWLPAFMADTVNI